MADTLHIHENLVARMRQHYRDAIQVQNACNLSGVALSFVKALEDIRLAVCAQGGGTDAVNRHPVVQMYVCKLHDLAGMGFSDLEAYNSAYAACEKGAL